MGELRIGLVGCGNISGIYLENLAKFEKTNVAACTDLDLERALKVADRHGIRACSFDDIVFDASIDLVLNLTVPKAHFEVALTALKMSKHVYNEKPLALERRQGKELVELAEARGLRLGCAPDTVLGAGIQTCRKLIDEGAIGQPVGASAFMMCPGHESWHPSPEFYYEKGGGPLFDMGPYYLSALFTLLGPAKRAVGAARTTFPTRTVTSDQKRGKVIQVETPTHIVGALELENGAIAQLTMSFDVQKTSLPSIEVYGTEGSLLVPDPNGFGGEVRLFRKSARDWETVPHSHGFSENMRGIGVLDIAHAIEEGRRHRANGELAMHVLDAMHAILEAAEQGSQAELATRCERPAPMPLAQPITSVAGDSVST